jgi:uncharacterized membrane protein YhaH (DUF805 family)
LSVQAIEAGQSGRRRRTSFFFVMALLMIAASAYGFSRTIGPSLLHAPPPVPAILWVHAAVFILWLVLFAVQAALVQARQVRMHRALGLSTLALGAALPITGVWVTIATTRMNPQHATDGSDPFMLVLFGSMLVFAVLFGLGAAYRRRAEAHRRLMFMATASLTAAAFIRYPSWLVPDGWFNACADALILCGAGWDLLVIHRVHPAYIGGLAFVVVEQVATARLGNTAGWLSLAHTLLGSG